MTLKDQGREISKEKNSALKLSLPVKRSFLPMLLI